MIAMMQLLSAASYGSTWFPGMSRTIGPRGGATTTCSRCPRTEYVPWTTVFRIARRSVPPRADSPAEKAIDAVVHLVGLLGAGAALDRLSASLGPDATTDQRLALAVYGLGLIGMLAMSAL